MDDELALFDVTPYLVDAPDTEPAEPLSAGRRRTIRQADAIRRGVHPLALIFGSVRMHPDANRDATATDPANLPTRCGSCHFRQNLNAAWRRSYPKCTWRAENRTDQDPHVNVWPRASHSSATDVRAWWPACRDYSPGDTTVSDDAARWIPDLAVA